MQKNLTKTKKGTLSGLLRAYGILLTVVGSIGLAIIILIAIYSVMLYMNIKGDYTQGASLAGFFTMMIDVGAALASIIVIYYLNCGIKILRAKYTHRRRVVHTWIILISSIAIALLACYMIRWGFWPDMPIANIALLGVGVAIAVMSAVCLRLHE